MNDLMPLAERFRTMKKMITALLLLVLFALSFSFTAAQKTPTVKRVQVTSKAIAGRRADQPYLLDFTRKGTIYTLATGSDYSRVRVHTSKGDRQISELLQGRVIKGSLIVGLTTDLRGQKLGLARSGGTVQFNCDDPLVCTCTGDADCNDLFTSGKCGDITSCDTGAGTCSCFKHL
jgi:hypothetical protein